ncbi:MAG: cadmium-translocating P-type ATPase [Gammaproteobacteria bacterium]|nr:cadmium-translocating P-type ATPase [Gammaproteobacteria bacterium]
MVEHGRNTGCFHCGLPVPRGRSLAVDILGQARPMCCPGCAAVAQAIVHSGLDDFYRHRTAPAPTGQALVPEFLSRSQVYDHPDVQANFVDTRGDHSHEVSLIIEGITCAACVWLNEKHLAALPGVEEVVINYSNHRARVRWDDRQIKLSDILVAVSEMGYLAHPYDPGRQQQLMDKERKQQLRYLAVAGALGMQVMMLAVALYAGDWFGIDPDMRTFMRWISLGLTTPVLLYSARPFFVGAWTDLQHGRTGMDVPVALGMSIAFAGSVWATITGGAHVYYDAVVMFTFFLLATRYFELMARRRSAQATESLVRLTPAMATRINAQATEMIPVAELSPGDRVLVRPGEAVPADGRIVDGCSSVDESLLSGESRPLTKRAGQQVMGGSINVDSPLTVEIEKTGADTVLSAILRLVDRAQVDKPAVAKLADRVAAWFVGVILILALGVASYWFVVDPSQWLPITIAILVVTCPCALSLATPAALAAGLDRSLRLGLLTTRTHALETLARTTHFVFDKTGTLSEGQQRLIKTHVFGGVSQDEVLQCAASLEQQSEHPLAYALLEACTLPMLVVSSVVNTPGSGIKGRVDGQRYFIGSPRYIEQETGRALGADQLQGLCRDGATLVLLASDKMIDAAFQFMDPVRRSARGAIEKLRAAGVEVMMMTGDHQQAARKLADEVGIHRLMWEQRPADKLSAVRALQDQGAVVAMVGDGINDAPVLAQAQVSIAMGTGSQLAAIHADMVLLGNNLMYLAEAVKLSRKTLTVIRQNLAWALVYNFCALPAAAMGYVPPWMAALGMSASSLLVVANSLRLLHVPRARKERSVTPLL